MGPKKILVVDDEIEILKFIEKVLTKNGYFVKTTINPFEAVDILKNDNFDIAILDLKMPEIDGMKLLEIIKKGFVKIEVIIITAHASVETAIECLKAGADDYLIKPFEIKELLATVEKTLEVKTIKSQLISLKEMDKLKDEFISTISHELKTPLMAISGAVEILSEQGKNENEKRETFRRQSDKDTHKLTEIISRQTLKMKKLVNDLLFFAKMEAGFLEIKKSSCELSKLVNDAVKEIQPLADSKKIELTQEIISSDPLRHSFSEASPLRHSFSEASPLRQSFPPPARLAKGGSEASAVCVNCDYEKVKQVLTNLLSNAIKYTQEGGKIQIDVRYEKPARQPVGGRDTSGNLKSDFIEVSVSDNGKGISKENLGKVFDKFYRVDQSLIREQGGFGLGLSIAQKTVELHGGKIRVESEGLGKGSTFIFTLSV